MGESHGNQALVTVTNLGTCISRKNKENNHVFVYSVVKYMIASLDSKSRSFFHELNCTNALLDGWAKW